MVFFDPAAADDPMTARVLTALPDTPHEQITPEALLTRERHVPLTVAKRRLFLTRDRGSLLKRCPGTRNRVCCNYFVINQGIGCPYDCSYCFLQDFSNLPAIFVYTNVTDLLAEVRTKTTARQDAFFRIGTGEMCDSLALDHLTGFSRELVPFFAGLPNALLELKTKSVAIENLVGLAHGGNTVVSWSLNPPRIAASDEQGAAPPEARIRAAAHMQAAGYRVGFHFDPLVLFPDWEREYRQLIKELAQAVDPAGVAWISLGSFRCRPPMKEVMDGRFPESTLTSGELLPCNDGKLRYFLPHRVALYRKIVALLREWSPDLFLYLCMEDNNVWEAVFGKERRPGTMTGVDAQFRAALAPHSPG
jgi:spore photoproduct lyase